MPLQLDKVVQPIPHTRAFTYIRAKSHETGAPFELGELAVKQAGAELQADIIGSQVHDV
jgi:alpha-D-ribose 1-methylphosphonate 5-triphosphate synthase subunit PhnG